MPKFSILTKAAKGLKDKFLRAGKVMKEERANFADKISSFPTKEIAADFTGGVKSHTIFRGAKSMGKKFKSAGSYATWKTSRISKGFKDMNKRFENNIPYNVGKFILKVPSYPVKTLYKHPVATSAVVGGIYGTGKSVAQQAERDTSYINQRGMNHNHLGTDGLSLALSKNRHRRR